MKESLGLAVAMALTLACSGSRPITNISCTAPPEVEAAYQATDDLWNDCGSSAACWRSKIEKARNLRDRFPQELLAHRALLITVYWAPWALPGTDVMKRDLRREYEALARRYPTNAAYPYILARLEDNPTRKVAFVGKALQLDPGFAWAHEAWITHRRKFSDAEKPEARVHAAAFSRLCPNRPAELLKALGQLQDRDAWTAAAPALRKAVTVENGRIAELPSLWEMEFRFAAPSDFDAPA